MNVSPGLYNFLTRVAVVLILLAVAIAVGLAYKPVIETNERMRKQIHRLDQEVAARDAEGRQLKAQIKALSEDPKTVEREIRARLGYAKPGETVIRFEAPATNAPPAR